MQPITIQECGKAILAEFKQNQYTENTMRTKIVAFNSIDRWFLEHGPPFFDGDIALAYEANVNERYLRGNTKGPTEHLGKRNTIHIRICRNSNNYARKQKIPILPCVTVRCHC